jgi:hypothetical protein
MCIFQFPAMTVLRTGGSPQTTIAKG